MEKAQTVLIIGLGTGVTLGSSLTYPDTQVSCIEIDRSVIQASTYSDHVSGKPLESAQVEIITADARTFLSCCKSKYDVIISEPSNPWISGVSNLFTFEHFNACQQKLKSDGIMCQWIHSYYMDTKTLMTLFRTFGKTFPYCNLWEGSPGDFLILGSRIPILSDPELIDHFLKQSKIKTDRNQNLSGSAY